jgi:phosphate uptake regulator
VLLDDLGQDLVMMARVVQSQVVAAVTAFFQKDVTLAEAVTRKDDQVDNLLGLIEETCFRRITSEGIDAESVRARQLRGAFRVALNLEKLGDYAVNVAEQAVHLSRLPDRPRPFDLAGAARIALAALDEVIESFTDTDGEKAKHACRCEAELDRHYREVLRHAFARLAEPHADPAFIITHLFVAKFLERMGDSILNIGETTLFILTGERLKLHQYLHLEQMVGQVAAAPEEETRVDIRGIWGGVSGARIGRLAVGRGQPLIWKEGAEGKIEDEIRAMEEWNRIVPGLVPSVKARYQRDGRESFLGQFLEGTLLRDVYLARPWSEKLAATRRLLETLREIWLATLEKTALSVDYVQQITRRLPELYALHPRLASLREGRTRVFGIDHPALATLLDVIARAEPALAAPVSVRIHGDFNTNNVMVAAARDRVHFIDVHRSGPGDYVQDIGVFLVSTVRTPIQGPRLAAHMERVNGMVYGFAAEFARLVGDEAFEVRLMLSRARSLITSGRVVTDGDFARDLYLRGVRLLEQVVRRAA